MSLGLLFIWMQTLQLELILVIIKQFFDKELNFSELMYWFRIDAY